jgi:serine/threonine-protein kinase
MSIFDCDLYDLADRIFDAYPEGLPVGDFDSYRILQPIGRGGMGEVYLAEDVTAGRRVAIKFLRPVGFEPDLPERFTREIKMLATLEHPFIGRLYDHGVRPDGTPWFAMEYVEGRPIDEYVRKQECSLEKRMELFRAVCEAVQYAHGRAVIHLDLKPSNILVKDDGTPKLLDFGISKHLDNPDEPAKQTQLRFTPAFAAPEQI